MWASRLSLILLKLGYLFPYLIACIQVVYGLWFGRYVHRGILVTIILNLRSYVLMLPCPVITVVRFGVIYTRVIQKVSTVCAYLSRILETVPLHMCSDFLYQLRSHRRHFVKFMLCLCLCLCLCVKHV